jgi:voltage-gated potassium channel
VVIGSEKQMRELDELLYIYDTNWSPVIIIGGGKGRTSGHPGPSKRRELRSTSSSEIRSLADRWQHLPGLGCSSEMRQTGNSWTKPGSTMLPAVLLTTNDDAMNVFLAVYCRRLNEKLRIVSRITHDRNIESIRRAGADLVMSYAGLGVANLTSMARGRRMIELGEGVELFEEDLPDRAQREDAWPRARSALKTGLTVVAVERGDGLSAAPRASEQLTDQCRLFMIGTAEAASDLPGPIRGPLRPDRGIGPQAGHQGAGSIR